MNRKNVVNCNRLKIKTMNMQSNSIKIASFRLLLSFTKCEIRWSSKVWMHSYEQNNVWEAKRVYLEWNPFGTICCLRHPYFIQFHHWNTVKCHVWKIYEKLFDMCNSLWASFVCARSLSLSLSVCVWASVVAFIPFHLKLKWVYLSHLILTL